MHVNLHKIARTTPAIRREWRESPLPIAELARRYHLTISRGLTVRQSRNVLRATPSPTATCRRGCPAANAVVATSSCSARSRRERCFMPSHRATTQHRRVATTRHLG
jgi:hypothetical protein